MPTQVLATSQNNVTHKFMLISKTYERFDLPVFHDTYESAFAAMLTSLAEVLEVDVEWLFEVSDEYGYEDDEDTFSFSRTSAYCRYHESEWEIVCVAVESGDQIRLTAVDNWPDEDIAAELYRNAGERMNF